MARRSDHTREELHKMALRAAHQIVSKEGLRGLSTRRIATKIGYTAGTLYQLFHDLDDLIMTLNGLTLDSLFLKCSAIDFQGEPEAVLQALADSYIEFVTKSPKLWTAVVEHNPPRDKDTPQWYKQSVNRLLGLVEGALAPLYPSDQNEEKSRDARVLWGSLYGIASLASADKLPPQVTPHQLAKSLIRNYLVGVRAMRTAKSRKAVLNSDRKLQQV